MNNIPFKTTGNQDAVFSKVSGSSGERMPATWRVNTSDIVANRPIVTITTKTSQNGFGKIIEGKLSYPIFTATADASTAQAAVYVDRYSFTATHDDRAGEVAHVESAHWFGQLVASAVVQAIMATGVNES